ncbi:sensor histidine kinase [Haloarcula onubensis]|uniref:histidine kinase n=1 Tax=Haloarcula onubensis TaxID=2950539 RepID=A0ABU2FTS9_9EURY|nr:PAS domain-containing sensor histidine kinase [Halomicroarcula sp. S3CR25-11]MDS0284159.1 PAS domain-containing sensor histidine kinase [Halomicroarcula sp. S3CR25-11]
MGDSKVLVVGEDGDEVAGFETALTDASVVCDAPGTVTVRLCRTAVDCLVTPLSLDGATGERVATAARWLYPDLPVVLYGTDATEATVGSVVDASRLDDAAVVRAVEAAVDSETTAARDPSRAETILASLFESIPAHMFVKDREGRHVLSTDHLVDPAELVGYTDTELNDDEPDVFRQAIYQDDRRVIDRGEVLENVEEYSRKYDVHLLTSKVPWRDSEGAVTGLVGLCREITDRKRREQALRASSERHRRVALKAAHELRNELQVATGRLELADAESSMLSEVERSHGRLTEIVDDVVRLAEQVETGSDRDELRLSTVVREVWETTETGSMRLTIEADGVFVAEPDSTRLLVETVISNALEHGGVDCRVTVGRTGTGFYLADDGPGISAEPPERVFEAGFSETSDSSGFGLYIVYRIADDNGWEVVVGESDDGGARFDVDGVRFID